ncbi:integrase core domain-containing protein [Aquimarina gracilis]|uniref:Integrase core domain-containing protein n=1 Tax=Aquimarina gracilis TaxID=874422 RepID=A0ABU6A2S7_9FLAO|nr:integrase core domain-containing protein [Aquimarina gracilis]MEB3348381.1 integrase core domain-containing protein [Aquimarina gracilis]
MIGAASFIFRYWEEKSEFFKLFLGRDKEYLTDYQVENIHEANQLLKVVVNLYNNERPHMSIGNLTPNQVHQNNLKTEKLWKNYYKK